MNDERVSYRDWLNKPSPLDPSHSIRTEIMTQWESDSFNGERVNKLLRMISSLYSTYDVVDVDNMFAYFNHIFQEYRDYYIEILDNYEKQYDYALNNKHTVTKTDNLVMTGSSNINTSTDSKDTDIQLPNKVVPTTYEGTPSAITKGENNGRQDKNYDNNTTKSSSYITEYNNEFIDLKNKYLNHIRNVYREFAKHFIECFYRTY